MNDGEKNFEVLIDTGATHNYIKKSLKFNHSEKIKPLQIISMHGKSIVNTKQTIKFMRKDIDFFEIDSIDNFDLILGWDGIRNLGAIINSNEIRFEVQEKKDNAYINFTIGSEKYKKEIEELMIGNNKIGPLPFTTTIEASIKTTTDDPIWTKQYPGNMNDVEFVNKEIQKLLEDGIIQKSFSPYNSPMLTVHKKGTEENGKPKRRMVIDFRKLNEHTVTDRYIIPDINITLQNLGKARYFTTLDLESGFHQIRIAEKDREKTAFCVNGGKYEFLRMPFGLKNAPSIFQRCVDDILREFIGKFAYVYIDDVIIYSSSPEEHIQHIHTIFNALNKANLKVSNEKSKFFMEEVEYLGHIVKYNKITTDPKKIKAIENFPIPKTLKDLRGFLGLTGYYRRFVKDYAQISKPLTLHLKGENAHIGKNKSKNTEIKLEQPAIEAVNKLKNSLKEQVELYQPNFNKPFELTTDASNIAIGAVLSQNRNPIYFLSRTLSTTEQNYSTNEKELLAIIWALKKLRNYIYGIADLTIFTDHQSLTYAISDKNPNPKLKRWKAIIEDYGAKLTYKPGTQNVVADALSRQAINTSSVGTVHSSDSSSEQIIKTVSQPFNAYGTQIELIPNEVSNEINTQIIFQSKLRHIIRFTNERNLITELKKCIQPKKITAIYTTAEDLFKYGGIIKNTFNTTKFVHTPIRLRDITKREEQIQLVQETHERAHRGYKNNIHELLEQYYWPDMRKHCKAFNKKCTACLYGKYERNPTKEPLQHSDIPAHSGEYIHIDIYFNEHKQYLVGIDKFSKYIVIRDIDTKADMDRKLEEILINNFPNCKRLMTDNEKCLNTIMVNQMCIKHNIKKIQTPVHRSKANGQVERAHNSISELSRIFKIHKETSATEELFLAVKEINNSTHSVTGYKPKDIHFNLIKFSKEDIQNKLRNASQKTLQRLNQGSKHRTFRQGDQVLVARTNIRSKSDSRYKKHIVQEDREDTILTQGGQIIHKNNIKNYVLTKNEDNIPNITSHGHHNRNNNSSRR